VKGGEGESGSVACWKAIGQGPDKHRNFSCYGSPQPEILVVESRADPSRKKNRCGISVEFQIEALNCFLLYQLAK
jgi:hypothetical protein